MVVDKGILPSVAVILDCSAAAELEVHGVKPVAMISASPCSAVSVVGRIPTFGVFAEGDDQSQGRGERGRTDDKDAMQLRYHHDGRLRPIKGRECTTGKAAAWREGDKKTRAHCIRGIPTPAASVKNGSVGDA